MEGLFRVQEDEVLLYHLQILVEDAVFPNAIVYVTAASEYLDNLLEGLFVLKYQRKLIGAEYTAIEYILSFQIGEHIIGLPLLQNIHKSVQFLSRSFSAHYQRPNAGGPGDDILDPAGVGGVESELALTGEVEPAGGGLSRVGRNVDVAHSGVLLGAQGHSSNWQVHQ